MKRIFLIGYMGAGKTTIGRELAKTLSLSFIDLDEFIQTRYNKSIESLFDELGEDKFRVIESKILQEISQFENVIISTGGGTPCFFQNITIMNKTGLTIYLKTDIQYLVQRLNLNKDKRPLIRDKSETELHTFIEENLTKRSLFYDQSHIIFDTGSLAEKEDIPVCVSSLIATIDKFYKTQEK